MSTITQKIVKRIRGKQRGWVFAPRDFLDIGSRASIDKTLSRLTTKGIIRRLDRGVYDFPKKHNVLGLLSPSPQNIARATASKRAIKIISSGATAANKLGLSTQIAAKPTFVTNGPTRKKKVAGRTVVFKHTKVPVFENMSDLANLTLQALVHLGKNNIDEPTIKRCANVLTRRDLRNIMAHLDQTPSWLADAIHRIKREKEDG